LGYRVQGVLVRAKPAVAALAAIEHAYGFRLYEVTGRGLFLMDLAIAEPEPGDRAVIRATRLLAPGYVDALRVLGADEDPLEQLAWLAGSAAVARQLRQPVLGFLSDDDKLDFAAVVKPEGVGVIGDKLGQFLLRWERGELVIQPFCPEADNCEPPAAPEELSLIPAVTLLETEKLASSGYPLHGNVMAEMSAFAEGTEVLGIGTWNIGPVGSLRLVEARGLDHGLWDRAVSETPPSGR
jgi:hypothetical protein